MAVTSAGVGQTAAAGPTGHCSKRRRGGSSPHVRPAARGAPAQAQRSGAAALGNQRWHAAETSDVAKALPQQTHLISERRVVPVIVVHRSNRGGGVRLNLWAISKLQPAVWALVHMCSVEPTGPARRPSPMSSLQIAHDQLQQPYARSNVCYCAPSHPTHNLILRVLVSFVVFVQRRTFFDSVHAHHDFKFYFFKL